MNLLALRALIKSLGIRNTMKLMLYRLGIFNHVSIEIDDCNPIIVTQHTYPIISYLSKILANGAKFDCRNDVLEIYVNNRIVKFVDILNMLQDQSYLDHIYYTFILNEYKYLLSNIENAKSALCCAVERGDK